MRKLMMIRGCNMAPEYVAAALIIVGLLGLNRAPLVAVAQPLGSACMFNAPTGATTSVHLFDIPLGHLAPAGHAGWGILDPVAGTWYFGATENSGGDLSVPAGGDDQTWNASGTMTDMLTAFMSTANFHLAGYYTRWICVDVANYNVNAALAAQAQGAASGFFGFWDNCLTKSVAIWNAYGNLNLYGGGFSAPNTYFDGLTNVGWGPVNYLAYPPGTGCMFNAPNGSTVGGPLQGGQVGWGFLDTGTGLWTFGATENNLGAGFVGFGSDTQSWVASGSQSDMFAAFTNSVYNHPAGYYLYYSCKDVQYGYVGGALNLQTIGAGSGYDPLLDNALTKTVAILSAYGEDSLSYPGQGEFPNEYFNGLTSVGWNSPQNIP